MFLTWASEIIESFKLEKTLKILESTYLDLSWNFSCKYWLLIVIIIMIFIYPSLLLSLSFSWFISWEAFSWPPFI